MKHINIISEIKRIGIYCFGLFVMAMGVSFSKVADLGMSPVNSIPYVLSEIFTSLSMGTWIMIIFSAYILIQFIILGKDIQLSRLLQLLCTVMFGYFTDFTNYMTNMFLPNPQEFSEIFAVVYGIRILYLLISMVLIALGIMFYLTPNLISLPGEGIMQVLSDKLHLPLHKVKMAFDIVTSAAALIISLIYFREFHGIREGTVIAAFGVGKILGMFSSLQKRVNKFILYN